MLFLLLGFGFALSVQFLVFGNLLRRQDGANPLVMIFANLPDLLIFPLAGLAEASFRLIQHRP